jgi:hypothetical protein
MKALESVPTHIQRVQYTCMLSITTCKGIFKSSGAHIPARLPLLSSPGLATISDDYGPGGAERGWTSRDSCESAASWMEQLADLGWSEPAASGLNDHATTWSGPTRQSNARDLELFVFSQRGTGRVTIIACWKHYFFLANRERFGS